MLQQYIVKSAVLRYFLILLPGIAVSACFDEPHFPNTPQITFSGISRYTLEAGTGVGQQKRDSLIITINFKDGDGDLGNSLPLNSNDSARFMQAGGWGNYRIRTFRLENNQYRELGPGENTFLIFPRLSREGKTGAIQGSLDFEQIYQYGKNTRYYPIKYRIQIRDRTLQVSNEIETDTITVPFAN